MFPPRQRPLAGASGRPSRWHWLAIPVALLLLIAAPASASAWDLNAFSASDESQLASLTNQRRASSGLPALKVDATLQSIARGRSKDMIVRGYFGHSIPPNGTTVFTELKARGYCYRLAAENIATGTWTVATATAMVAAQLAASPSHLANILGSEYRVFGVGAYQGADGKKVWTVLFANPCSSSPAVTAPPAQTAKPPVKATPRPTSQPAPAATEQPVPDPTAISTPEIVLDFQVDSLVDPPIVALVARSPLYEWLLNLVLAIIRDVLATALR